MKSPAEEGLDELIKVMEKYDIKIKVSSYESFTYDDQIDVDVDMYIEQHLMIAKEGLSNEDSVIIITSKILDEWSDDRLKKLSKENGNLKRILQTYQSDGNGGITMVETEA